MKDCQDDFKSRNRRNNLVFYGFPDIENETEANWEEALEPIAPGTYPGNPEGPRKRVTSRCPSPDLDVASGFRGFLIGVPTKAPQDHIKFIVCLPQPHLFNSYNSGMGGVDLHDQTVNNFRICIHGRKWWWPLFTQDIPLRGPVILAKAADFALQLDYDNFTASDGWFIYVDVGHSGSDSDGGIFSSCDLQKNILPRALGLPPVSTVGNEGPLPYFFVGDEAFPLKEYMMWPYARRTLHEDDDKSYERRVFNYRMSRARHTIENTFGILAQRWRVLCRPIRHSPLPIAHLVPQTARIGKDIFPLEAGGMRKQPAEHSYHQGLPAAMLRGVDTSLLSHIRGTFRFRCMAWSRR
ncbi:hypothetical protein HPB51_010422 [Rhipicephalus microplus]|uniref:DDE Tnp4 domain-containing protein n=1 Tax=Rhipicephalus microplus TaxID=6941 RepID=A0A9J6F2W9_RHIMP|nr:hypothetical protein HPB51_010422 [Rhipicephalus microplus]